MKLYRMWGIFLRYFYSFAHSMDRMSDTFYWPLVDLVIWGITSSFYLKGEGGGAMILALLGGVLLWIFPWRSQYEISVNLLEDLWNRNLVNMFATPIKFGEWLATLLLMGIGKAIISFAFAGGMAYLLYYANIFTLGPVLLPWAALLVLFGWVFGLLVTSIIMRYGTKIQNLAWTSIYLLVPFVAIYYPVSALPTWAQIVSKWVPASYVFEAMRATVAGHPPELSDLFWPTMLCLVYLVMSLAMIKSSFKHILKRGLISVE
jgi:ABC-2 type transport system permease protein